MDKIRVLTVVGTRPELIRLSCTLSKLDEYVDHVLVHTGQNYDYELNEVFFEDLGIRKPDYFLDSAGSNASVTIGNILIKIDEVLEFSKPDAVLVLGDTNSCLSVIPAKRRKIPIFHMEAGNRCFDQRVPEEINRKIVDHVSDINLTYSDISREYLIQEGFPAEQVIKTGSPMFEVLNKYSEKIENSNVLEKLNLKKFNYFVFSSHREENIDQPENFEKILKIIDFISKNYGKDILVSTHPRTRKKIDESKFIFQPNVLFHKPLGFFDYIFLQKYSSAVLSDSGTISEESSIINFPALNIREAHERPEAMEEASVILTGLNLTRIIESLKLLEGQPRLEKRLLSSVKDYSYPNVSEKVIRIILSYTDYINRRVWYKRD